MSTDIAETCMFFAFELKTSECASWVQAWGSIAAILASAASVFIAHLLAKNQAKKENFIAETRFLEGLFQLVGGARGVAAKLMELEKEGPSSPHDRMSALSELESFRDALQRVDLSKLYRYELLAATLIAESNVRLMISAIQWVMRPEASTQLERNYLASVSDQAVRSIDPQAAYLYGVVEKRGGAPQVAGLLGIPPHAPNPIGF